MLRSPLAAAADELRSDVDLQVAQPPEEESRSEGDIRLHLYVKYFRAGGSLLLLLLLFSLNALAHVSQLSLFKPPTPPHTSLPASIISPPVSLKLVDVLLMFYSFLIRLLSFLDHICSAGLVARLLVRLSLLLFST